MKKPSRLAQRRLPPKRKRNYKKYIFLLPIIVIAILILWFFVGSSKWDGAGRLGLAIYEKSGDVTVANFDAEAGTITTILIPGTTQVEAAKNLGTWRLASIPKLGDNEKAGGDFVTSTITKSFKFPVEAWADETALGLTQNNLIGAIKSAFNTRRTNLSLKDRIRLALFSVGVKDSQHVEINLPDTKYIRKSQLPDGSQGYEITGDMPLSLMSVFSDSDISQAKLNILITNATGENKVAADVSKIIEVMGGKVTSIQKISVNENLDCEILSRDFPEVSEKISKVFHCKVIGSDPSGNFNLEIKIGKMFKARF
jgi:hypothetical protein